MKQYTLIRMFKHKMPKKIYITYQQLASLVYHENNWITHLHIVRVQNVLIPSMPNERYLHKPQILRRQTNLIYITFTDFIHGLSPSLFYIFVPSCIFKVSFLFLDTTSFAVLLNVSHAKTHILFILSLFTHTIHQLLLDGIAI